MAGVGVVLGGLGEGVGAAHETAGSRPQRPKPTLDVAGPALLFAATTLRVWREGHRAGVPGSRCGWHNTGGSLPATPAKRTRFAGCARPASPPRPDGFFDKGRPTARVVAPCGRQSSRVHRGRARRPLGWAEAGPPRREVARLFSPHPAQARLATEAEGAGDAPRTQALPWSAAATCILQPLAGACAFGREAEGAPTRQALGPRRPVVRVAVFTEMRSLPQRRQTWTRGVESIPPEHRPGPNHQHQSAYHHRRL